MPSRILREGILTSPRIAKLGWAEEVFYRRLHSVVDDFGRYFADVGLLRSGCYPRQLNKVSDSDIGKWLQVIADAALVRVYPAQDGERYLEVLDFGQQVRAKKSKFPEPLSESEASAQQMLSKGKADAPVFVSVSVGEAVSVSGDGAASQSSAPPAAPPPAFDGKNAERFNGKAVVAISPAFDLPEEWGTSAEALGFKPREVLFEAERFRQYWTVGDGAGKRRAVKGWRQSWSNWLRIAAEKRR